MRAAPHVPILARAAETPLIVRGTRAGPVGGRLREKGANVLTRLKRLPSPAIVISVIALFVALGGSVYAASNISGKTIKKGSLPGNRLKKNTVTGKQVKESTLGAVPS